LPGARCALPYLEIAVLFVVAPVLWFPTVRPGLVAPALGVLALTWACVCVLTGVLWPTSPYDVPLLLLLACAGLGAYTSRYPILTLPKVCSLILGVAVWRVIVLYVDSEAALLATIAMVLGLALVFAAVGLSNGLRPYKVSELGALWRYVRKGLQDLPETEGGRASMNQLGGALLLVWPVCLALVLLPARDSSGCAAPSSARVMGIIGSTTLGAALLLTQCRGAWIGALVAVSTIVILRWQWGRIAAIATAAIGMVRFLVVGRGSVQRFLNGVMVGGSGLDTRIGKLSLEGRVRIWIQSWIFVRDNLLLGGGLGTYRARYAGWPQERQAQSLFSAGLPHAHNLVLQMAYDVGVFGLLAYVLIIVVLLVELGRVASASRRWVSSVAIGAIAGLLAHHCYGLTDVVALGSKPGVLFWALFGLAATLPRFLDRCCVGAQTTALG